MDKLDKIIYLLEVIASVQMKNQFSDVDLMYPDGEPIEVKGLAEIYAEQVGSSRHFQEFRKK